MFKHLHEKLAALYAALFIGIILLISVAVFVATTQNVEHVVRDQLAESGVIFEHLSATQNSRMREEAGVLARDFGFRAAVATQDVPTIRSALDNLAARIGIDGAFMVSADGQVIAHDGHAASALPADTLQAIQAEEADQGVVVLQGVASEVIAMPIRAPALAGWVVFTKAIGPDALQDLDKLSTLPLEASVLIGAPNGQWSSQGRRGEALTSGVRDLINGSLSSNRGGAVKLVGANGGSVVLARRLPAFGGGPPVVLLLRCPLAEALRPFGALAVTIAFIGAFSLVLIVVGSWLLARTLTRPIATLDDAVHRLQRGEAARVAVTTQDEIARLGASFNAMADEIVEREASLKKALEVAEAANKAKSIFLANMNHEVRTPLNGVVGVAGLMASTPLDANQRQMVEIIENSGAALQRILNDVLDMVDLGADELDLMDAPFSLTSLLTNLVSATSAQAVAKGLDFKPLMEGLEHGWVRGDEGRIRQILVNLLDNAVKFTETGQVDFHVGRCAETHDLCFEVKDTGMGFDPARTEELFTAFNQADGSMTRRAGGTGLGLSLARDLARAMGGDIKGQGALGQGATFVFSVPLDMVDPVIELTEDAFVEADPDLQAQDAEEYGQVRILMADDHAYNRMVIELILAGVDTDVVSVENGQEAVDAFKQQTFDVVLMDLQMPVMDGFTAIKLIRDYERDTGQVRTPVLVISANVQAPHLRASAEAGADGHLAKPILAPTLIQALDDCLSGRSQTANTLAA